MSKVKNQTVRVFLSGFTVALFFAALSHPLQAQTFAPIPALAFTKPFGGANPLPQTVTVASVGTGLQFRNQRRDRNRRRLAFGLPERMLLQHAFYPHRYG